MSDRQAAIEAEDEEALDPRRVAAILEAVEAGDALRLQELAEPLHAAEELYEKLPVVGALMRWLKKRANR